MKILILLTCLLFLSLVFIPSCDAVDTDILPVSPSTYDVGSVAFPWAEGHYDALWIAGAPAGGGGGAPDPHAASHEDTGADEISIAGLSGEPADTVNETLFDANSILYATIDNTPVALSVGASRVIGRKAAGNIIAMTGTELMVLLSGQAGADFSMNSNKITSVTDPVANQDAATKKYVDDNFVPTGLPRLRAHLVDVQTDLIHSKTTRVELANTTVDTESAFKTDTWQAGVGDAGSNATTIVDADPTTGTGFVAAMKLALVTWDAGASTGYIQTVDSGTQVSILKNAGTDFTVGDTYTIKKAHYEVPTSGYWMVMGLVGWFWASIVADEAYNGGITVNGEIVITSAAQASKVGALSNPFSDIMHLDSGDIVALNAISYAGVNVADVNGGAAGFITYLAMVLLEAD